MRWFYPWVSQHQTQQVMTSLIRSHIEYSEDLSYSDAYFIVEIDEKFSLNGGFYYDLMMIRDSDFLFWAILYNSRNIKAQGPGDQNVKLIVNCSEIWYLPEDNCAVFITECESTLEWITGRRDYSCNKCICTGWPKNEQLTDLSLNLVRNRQ